jgi:hypothetical protein
VARGLVPTAQDTDSFHSMGHHRPPSRPATRFGFEIRESEKTSRHEACIALQPKERAGLACRLPEAAAEATDMRTDSSRYSTAVRRMVCPLARVG